jgi:hypothetical protein
MSAGGPTPPNPQPGFEQVIVPPAASSAVPYPPAPSNVYAPPQPPASSGNNVLKIVLIVVGIFVLLGVLAAGIVGVGIWKVSRAIRRASSDGVHVTTPDGTTVTSGSGLGIGTTVNAADLGVAIYPGAVSGQGSMHIKTSSGSMFTAVYTTTDSPTQVVDFYKDKMGSDASVVETDTGAMLTSGTSGHDKLDKLIVTVSKNDDKTKIAIVHTTHAGS